MGLAALTVCASAAIDPDFYGEWKSLQNRCLKAEEEVRNVEGKAAAAEFVAKALAAFGENHDFTANALHWLAHFTQHTGNLDEAEKLWWRALAIDEALHGINSIESSRRLLLLGRLYSDKGDFPRADELFRRAHAIRRQHLGDDNALTANILLERARLCILTAQIEKAEGYLEKALAIQEKALRRRDPNATVVTGLLDLAAFYVEINDVDSAERCVELELEAEERTGQVPRWLASRRAGLLGYIHVLRGSYSEAEHCFKESIALIQSDPSAPLKVDSWGLVACLPLASLYLRRGNISAAEALGETVLEPLAANENIRWADRSWALRLLAKLKQASGDDEGAARVLQKARSLMESIASPAQREKGLILKALAKVQYGLGNTNEAVALAQSIQDCDEHRLNEILSFTSEHQRLTYTASLDRDDGYSLWASVGAVRPLARAILRTKALVLDSLIEDRSLAGQNGDQGGLLERVQQARNRVVDLNSTLARSTNAAAGSGDESENLASALRELDSAQSALARRVTRRGSSRRALEVTLEQVQCAIPTNAAVLEIICYDQLRERSKPEKNYGALVLLAASEPRWVPLGPVATLDRNVQFYRHALRTPAEDESLNGVLKELSGRLWQPLTTVLPQGLTNIIVSPDSQLNFVSFAALPQSNGRFVGEDFAISYVSTARDLLEQDPRSPHSDRTLAIWAGPAFSDAPCQQPRAEPNHEPVLSGGMPIAVNHAAAIRELRDLQLSPLNGARREGEQLQRNASRFGFTASHAFLGPDATEAQLRRVAAPHVLHLASHGFFLPAVVELRDNNSGKTASSRMRARLANNPMLRSGIALAGAQWTLEAWKRGEYVPAENDGIVTAEEVASLDLRDTTLVVLSACDTGAGQTVAGEGVLGLRRGFIQAGTENLLVALWSVDDSITADFFLDFYKSLGTGVSPAHALSQTQARWLNRLRLKTGIGHACRIAGPFVLSCRGNRLE